MAKKKAAKSPSTKKAAKKKTAKKPRKKKAAKSPAKKKAAKKPRKKKAYKRPLKVVEYSLAMRAVSRYGDELKKLPGVTGLSVGPRFKEEKPTKEMTIRLHVSTDEEKQYLIDHADELGLKRQYGGIGTDIVVWNFELANGAADVPDGSRINGKIGFGTLGTQVIITLDSQRTVVWLTADHVASPSRPRPGSPVAIRHNRSVIGTVSTDHYFRDKEMDAAYIVPKDRITRRPPRRRMKHLMATDEGQQVTLDGAVTKNSDGTIISLFYEGVLADTKEPVTDHFLVHNPSKDFAVDGDSGAIVKLGGELVGILRAVDSKKKISVVGKLTVFSSNARDLDQGFIL